MKTRTEWKSAVFAAVAICLGICWGCDRDTYSLNVSPEQVSITDAHSHPLLKASVLDVDGEEIAISDVEWLSSNTSIVSVDESGRLTAHANGNAIITAKNRGDEKEVAVIVRLGEPE